MDPNGLRVWQVADAAGFGLDGTPPAGPAQDLHWRTDARLLRLDRQQAAPALAENQAFARAQAGKPSPVSDPGGSFAWWDGVAGTLRAAGFGTGSTPIALPPDTPPGLPQPTDLAFGTDDVLYVARNDGVVMADRRDRWLPARVDLAGFRAQRLAPAPGGGVWALDRISGQVARLTGHPMRVQGYADPGGERFRPVEPNPRPPRLRLLRGARLPSGVEGIAIAASQGGRVAVLAWVSGQDAALYTLEDRRLVRRFALQGLRFPYSLAFSGEDRVAVLASDGTAPGAQAFVYELDPLIVEGASARPLGEIHPLVGIWHGGFCNRLNDVPEYPLAGATPSDPAGLRRLRPLSRATYARSGRVTIGPFDAGQAGSVWHRLYVEASVPDNAGVRIWAHADDAGGVPVAPSEVGAASWAPHIVGAASVPRFPDAPAAAWCDEASEMPFNPGLSVCPREPGHSGLFTVLLQRAGTRVRRIEGRWLWLHLELLGDSQVTPEIAAIRVHGARFAYRDHYLPAFYRETLAGPDAARAGAATPHDFLDRMLGLFEGNLTLLEQKVAESWLLTDPAATPDDALPWLASWIGVESGAAATPFRQRQDLRAAPWTARLHGTLGGMNAALELATGGQVLTGGAIDPTSVVPRPGQLALANLANGIMRVLVLSVADPDSGAGSVVLAGGAVSRGEIVVVEGWRLRRTFATILGADLANEDDPLTLGLVDSGNSFVGDTLFLGDEAHREFMALFAADLPQSAADRAAVAAFFERLAFRVMILVRDGARTADLARIRDTAETEAPAHVETSVHVARQPLMIGAASLVGIDTFLLPEPPPRRVRVGRTQLGAGDLVAGEGRLDARADGPVSPRPVAVADGPTAIPPGASFLLSSARSEAASGRSIARNIWTWI
ncbi:MAG: phage tail protein [Acetobacteraceae bacterium]